MIEVLQRRIEELSQSSQIIVLKGFPVVDIIAASQSYPLLDAYILEGDKIDLQNVNAPRLCKMLFALQDSVALMTYESFYSLTVSIRDLSILGKNFCVLSNNLLRRYKNETTISIPDFDSQDFQNEIQATEEFANYYSYCIHEDEKEYIQYINYDDSGHSIVDEVLIKPIPVRIESDSFSGGVTRLTDENATLVELFEDIYAGKSLGKRVFSIDKHHLNDNEFAILQGATDALNLDFHFCLSKNEVKVDVRQELKDLLKSTWGYDSFRSLQMYNDLDVDRSIVSVSQGEIIETVVRQAEEALHPTGKNINNVLLTSPTGAGKSLLFQLSAIYLANKYQTLTIVVSPLVALMNDQVENLVGNYKGVATLNGNMSANDKEEVTQMVQEGKINILYLAPELLLSYTISSFIGNRRIGLFVIDEAHTVTTWGRDFRVDYWFLGDYLRSAKRQLKQEFPIFALTATAVWDPSGKNDMVFDTISSLNMDPCIKFIGVVRRDDIHFDVQLSSITRNYERERNRLTSKRIHESLNNKLKTIVYFPYKSTIAKMRVLPEMQDCNGKVTEYHASLTPAEKIVNAEDFKTGRKLVMCATKAYGMGVDVSDINMVYHHAPTGCLSDYVQEIGRVARDPSISGVAKIDFSDYDFRFTRTLHGLSAIKPYQLRAVLRQLMAIYRLKGEKRNMLISADDFQYIFPGTNVDYDQKLKSSLLLISHDLLNKLQFNAIIVRPKNLFSKAFIRVPKAQLSRFKTQYHNYIHDIPSYPDVFKMDIDILWNKIFSNLSFPNFKRLFAEGSILNGYNITILNKITLLLNTSIQDTRTRLSEFFKLAESFINDMQQQHTRFTFDKIKGDLPGHFDDVQREAFLESMKLVYADGNGMNGITTSFCSIHSQNSFQVIKSGASCVRSQYLSVFDKMIQDENQELYACPISDIVKLSELLSSLNLADVTRQGGDEPSIFIRINNPTYLYDLVRKNNYDNDILNNIYEKFAYSEWCFSYFFTHPMTDKVRWDFIEAYFLGADKDALIKISNE